MQHRRVQRLAYLLAVWTLVLLARTALALTPLAALRYAPDITVVLGGTTVTPQNVAEDHLTGSVTLVPIGTIPNGTDALAYYQLAGGDQLLAFDTDVSLAGPITARPGDVVRFDGTNYTKYFDAAANGIPTGVMTDAVSLIGGTDLLLSFDVTVALGSVTARPADLVRFNGTTFTLFFDGAGAGVPDGLNLDGAYYVDASGHLLLSFDGSGTLGGVAFNANDVLEYAPGTGTWEKAYNGTAQFAAWAPANLVAPFALLPVCGNGIVEPGEQCDDGNTADGDCCSSTCQYEADGSPCGDNDACTQTDTCKTGVCIGGNPVVCTALDQCHEAGTCDAASGQCSNPAKADGAPCDDNVACNGADTCSGGVCSSHAHPCVPTITGGATGGATVVTGVGGYPNEPAPCIQVRDCDGDRLCGTSDDVTIGTGGTDAAGNFRMTVAPALTCGEKLYTVDTCQPYPGSMTIVSCPAPVPVLSPATLPVLVAVLLLLGWVGLRRLRTDD